MSGALQRIRLPREAQAWAKKLNLVSFVNDKKWNSEPRFKILTQVRETWTIAGLVEVGDDPDAIVSAAFVYFAADQEFIDYVLKDCSQEMTADGEWEAATAAYTWVVLQRYNRELGGEDD